MLTKVAPPKEFWLPYCIYTDAEVPKDQGNFDHVIPLSLGGSNQFQVWSSEEFNSEMGTRIDDPIANDPLIMLARRNADARGLFTATV